MSIGDSYQWASLVDGNASNFLNFNDLTTGLPATQLPLNSNGDSIDSCINGDATSGTFNAPITSMSVQIAAGVICNFAVTNDMGTFNGICNGFFIDVAGNGCSTAILNGGGSVGNFGIFALTLNGNSLLVTNGAGLIGSNILGNLLCSSGVGDLALDGVTLTGEDFTYDFSGVTTPITGVCTEVSGLLILPDSGGNSGAQWTGISFIIGDRVKLGTGQTLYAPDSPALPKSVGLVGGGFFRR